MLQTSIQSARCRPERTGGPVPAGLRQGLHLQYVEVDTPWGAVIHLGRRLAKGEIGGKSHLFGHLVSDTIAANLGDLHRLHNISALHIACPSHGPLERRSHEDEDRRC